MGYRRRQLLGMAATLGAVPVAGCEFGASPGPADDGTLPPGVTETTVRSVYHLLVAHHSLLLERGFTVEHITTKVRYDADGQLTGSGQRVRKSRVEGRNEVLSRLRVSGTFPFEPHFGEGFISYEYRVDTDRYWDGERNWYRFHTEEGPVFEDRRPPDDGPTRAGGGPTYRGALEADLVDAEVIAVDRTVDGSVQQVHLERRVQGEGSDARESLLARSTRARVDAEGIVRRATTEVLREPRQGPPRERVITRYHFTAIGETVVSEPSWVR